MLIGKKELRDLHDLLEQLTNFIRLLDGKELPYFYHCFDAMKNNIELFQKMGENDLERLYTVLERDWKASHRTFLGVQEYDLREDHPDADLRVCLYFAGLVSKVERYFEEKTDFYA